MFALACLSRWSFFVDHLSLQISGERAIDYLNTRPRLYVLDGFAGWDPEFRYKRLGQQREIEGICIPAAADVCTYKIIQTLLQFYCVHLFPSPRLQRSRSPQSGSVLSPQRERGRERERERKSKKGGRSRGPWEEHASEHESSNV